MVIHIKSRPFGELPISTLKPAHQTSCISRAESSSMYSPGMGYFIGQKRHSALTIVEESKYPCDVFPFNTLAWSSSETLAESKARHQILALQSGRGAAFSGRELLRGPNIPATCLHSIYRIEDMENSRYSSSDRNFIRGVL